MGVAYQRGLILYSQKRYGLAAEEFSKELSQFPKSAAAMSMRALSLTYDRKVEEGIAEAKAAVGASPEAAFAHYALACALVGPPFWRKVTLLNLIGARARQIAYRRRLRKAKGPAMEAIRLDPNNADFLALVAAIELDLQRPQKALEWANRGLAARADNVRCANVRAKALAKLGNKGAAIATVRSALAIDPENAWTHATGGWTNLQAGNPRQAEEHFRQSLRLDPNDARAQHGLKLARRGTPWKSTGIIFGAILALNLASALGDSGSHTDPAERVVIVIGIVVVIFLPILGILKLRDKWKGRS